MFLLLWVFVDTYIYIGGSLICKALINCLQTNNDVITGYKGILIIKDCFSSFSNHVLNISVSAVFCLSLRACECHLCARTPGSARAGLWWGWEREREREKEGEKERGREGVPELDGLCGPGEDEKVTNWTEISWSLTPQQQQQQQSGSGTPWAENREAKRIRTMPPKVSDAEPGSSERTGSVSASFLFFSLFVLSTDTSRHLELCWDQHFSVPLSRTQSG